MKAKYFFPVLALLFLTLTPGFSEDFNASAFDGYWRWEEAGKSYSFFVLDGMDGYEFRLSKATISPVDGTSGDESISGTIDVKDNKIELNKNYSGNYDKYAIKKISDKKYELKGKNSTVILEKLHIYLYKIAVKLNNQKKYEAAKILSSNLIPMSDDDESSANAYFQLAYAEGNLGNYEECIKWYKLSLNHRPGDKVTIKNLKWAEEQLKKAK